MNMTGQISPSRLAGAAVVVCMTLTWMARLSAHPTATSFVIINDPTGPVINVTITTEAESLLMKLEALAGVARPVTGLTPAAVDRRLGELGATLLEQVDLRLDDARATLAMTTIERVKDRPERVQIVLSCATSKAATTLRWRTSLFFGSYPLAVRADSAAPSDAGTEQYEWLSGSQLSQPYALGALASDDSGWTRASRLVAIGFTHIVPGGWDHVLFVLGLFLLAANARTLLLQISAFTVAHSCTLALAMAGWVSVPGRIVEPLIAVSIAYIAVENLMTTALSRWRLAVVFVFGLLHGLGFASALAELGLSEVHFASTLVGFNVGVELGQIAVVLAATLLVRALSLTPEAHRQMLVRPASAAIAAIGMIWAVQRVFL